MSVTMTLSDSFVSTIITTLARDGGPQARETLRELKRWGVRIPVWIQRDVLDADTRKD